MTPGYLTPSTPDYETIGEFYDEIRSSLLAFAGSAGTNVVLRAAGATTVAGTRPRCPAGGGGRLQGRPSLPCDGSLNAGLKPASTSARPSSLSLFLVDRLLAGFFLSRLSAQVRQHIAAGVPGPQAGRGSLLADGRVQHRRGVSPEFFFGITHDATPWRANDVWSAALRTLHRRANSLFADLANRRIDGPLGRRDGFTK